MQPKQKLVAGLLGIFLGAWGIHQFYLGDNKKGIIRIVVTLVTCGIGGIWGFIRGSSSSAATSTPMRREIRWCKAATFIIFHHNRDAA